MYIKNQRGTLSLIRTTYDKTKKGPVQKSVGNLPERSTSIPDELRSRLTEEEQAQLTDYLQAMQAQREQESHVLYARSAHSFVRHVREAVESKAALEDPAKLWAEIALLTKALRKAGHPRPKKAASDAKPA